MHEVSLVEALLQQVEDLRQAHGMDRVIRIQVSVGEMAGVEPELMQSAFAWLAPAAGAEGAELELTEVPLEARCRGCGSEFRVERFCFVCPVCAGWDLTILRGETIILQRVTFQKGPDPGLACEPSCNSPFPGKVDDAHGIA